MKKIHNIQKINFINGQIRIRVDGKEYIIALSKISKRLLKASTKEREKYEISPAGLGIHWPLIDEDISIEALLGIKHTHSFKEFSNR